MYLLVNADGISQKYLASNPSGGIGLNPNLNIEDEYIENLLKQVHFLNMEIKLMYFPLTQQGEAEGEQGHGHHGAPL